MILLRRTDPCNYISFQVTKPFIRSLVQMDGFEPSIPNGHRFLRPTCIPVPTHLHNITIPFSHREPPAVHLLCWNGFTTYRQGRYKYCRQGFAPCMIAVIFGHGNPHFQSECLLIPPPQYIKEWFPCFFTP